jgi:hypothetical protein
LNSLVGAQKQEKEIMESPQEAQAFAARKLTGVLGRTAPKLQTMVEAGACQRTDNAMGETWLS